ncbi:hypothetical protein HDV06_005302 [Boothiomyces sp. JEL0866]|nr:hypothetical protein HDV06_005302 [Boothiomyces sp. JEL0866]
MPLQELRDTELEQLETAGISDVVIDPENKHKLFSKLATSASTIDSKQSEQDLGSYDDSEESDFSEELELPSKFSQLTRKWKTEAVLVPKTAPSTNLKKWDTQMLSGDKGKFGNPLKLWRANHMKTLNKGVDLIELEDGEQDLDDREADIDNSMGTLAESQRSLDQIPEQKESKKSNFIKDFLSKKKNPEYVSKIPKLKQKDEKKDLLAKVSPKPNPLKLIGRSLSANRTLSASKPFLKRFLDLSKSKVTPTAKELVPARVKIFDDEEEGEFDNNPHALEEIERFNNNYTVIKQIGTGGHSTVRLAERKSDGQQVVAKFIHSSNVWHWHNETPTKKLPLEICMMREFKRLDMKEMIQYIEHFEVGQRYIIIMEFLGSDWIDLYDYIELFGPVEERQACHIFKNIVKIIQKMYRLGYSHNDIKDENIMIHKSTMVVKLIDFGSTMPIKDEPTTTFYGTQKFSSPEALGGNLYYPVQQEVWALGTLLYVLLFKMDPFANDEEIMELDIGSRIDRLRTSVHGKGLLPIELSEAAVDALTSMLSKYPNERPKVENLLELEFFRVNEGE